jgi:YfiR/HmsC-like
MGLLRHIRALRLRLRYALVLLAACGLAGVSAPVSEYQLKAVFLFNFAHFVEWPAAALPHDNAPFVIGVLGKDPFGRDLDDVVHGEGVNQRPLAIERYATVADIRNCQILFIPGAEARHLEGVVGSLQQHSVLTVTDVDGPLPRGVIIGLFRQDNRIRMRIDLQAAKASNLTISSKLSRAAEIVGSGS